VKRGAESDEREKAARFIQSTPFIRLWSSRRLQETVYLLCDIDQKKTDQIH
jgi:hypothetical protein